MNGLLQRILRGGNRTLIPLVLVVAASMAGGLALIGIQTWDARETSRQQSGATVRSIARIVAEQTARTMQTIDLTVLGAIEGLTYNRIYWQFDPQRLHDYLRSKQERSELVRNLYFVNAQGLLIGEAANFPPSPLTLDDRPYFSVHQQNPQFGLYISPPMISRVTLDWAFYVSRRIERSNGGFDGVMVAGTDVSRLRESLGRAQLGAGSEIALFLEDGSLLVRSANDGPLHVDTAAALDPAWMARAQNDSKPFQAASPIDGARRIYSLQRVPGQPIYVLAGIDEAAAMREWQRQWLSLASVAAVAVLAIVLLGLIAFRDSRRREALLSALRDSETRFRDFAQAASDRFWETDAEHRLTWHSALHGTPDAEWPDYIGKTRWGNLGIDPDQDPHWGSLKAEMDAHRTFRDFRYMRPKEDGSLRHRIVSGKPAFDENGVFLGYRGIYSDITSQVTIQEQAQKSRDRFLRSIESLTEGFALYDADDRMVVCNSRFREIYAPVRDSLLRWSSFEDFLRECIANNLIPEAAGHEEEWIAKRLLRRRDQPSVMEVERKGRWIEIRERPDKEGGTMMLVLDIHEQKVAELRRQALAGRLQMMIDNMPSGCLLLDCNRRILDWNPAATQIFGYSKAEALGADCLDLIVAPELHTEIGQRIERIYSGEDVVTHVSVNRTKDGRAISCEWTSSRLLNDAGQCVGLLSMTRDVSEKRAAEEKMRQLTRMEAIGQLTGGIAHDFNNLLQVIIGNCEILDESLADQPRLQRWATMSRKAAEHGAELTLRLLAYSKRQTLEPVDVDLNGIIEDVTPLIARSIGESVNVTSSFADVLWPAALDRGQIDQALLNVVLNARDAMPNGGTLHIETSNVCLGLAETAGEAKPGDYVCVAISDNGVGMPPDVLKRAFEPFFSTKGVGKGNGLGLSMVQGFVNQSGGLVRLESEVGKGTIVRIYFPRSASRTPDKPNAEQKSAEAPRKTIFVVEDNDMVRNYVTAQLESLGYDVLEAENGPAALAKIDAAGPVDLLFTDVIMPGGMNGRELAEQAVERRPGLKVLFTSGYDESAITTDGYLTEGLYLLKKPYQRKDLEAKIIEVLAADAASVAA
ncbi:MAG TPA: PAS domain S-box protein [Alphaproteobacteria bacterium]|nr:PAS domain S-box protein [Alphaproteobacteria bacterium]